MKLQKQEILAPDQISHTIERYMKHRNMNTDDLGRSIGVTGQTVRNNLARSDGDWRNSDIVKYAAAVGCPGELLADISRNYYIKEIERK